MDSFSLLADGFANACTLTNILAVFVGVLVGQILGILPGIGPAAGMALLLPVTFGMDPATAIIMLCGIMYGGNYGGTLTSVLINVPGESSSVMTAVDGHQLARQGRAGAALSVSAIGSFLGGSLTIFPLMFATQLLSRVALNFGVPEYFLLALLGIAMTATLGLGSPLKAFLSAVLGLMVAIVGLDPLSGQARLTFGYDPLLEGISFLPIAIGIFGVAEVLASLEQERTAIPMRTRLRELWLTRQEWIDSRMAIFRGGVIGFAIGVLPGVGPTVASILAYVSEKRFSRHPERFGRGAIDGVASTETANNTAINGALVPMLAFGIPGSTGTAVLLAGLFLAGIRPGPQLMTEQASLVWTLMASMFIGNFMLLLLNLPLAPVFAAMLRIRYAYLAPCILVFSMIGSYASTLNPITVFITLIFGVVGYLMMKAEIPRAPLILAVVLAPLLENSFRQSLTLSDGSLLIFVERPVSAILVAAIAISWLWPMLSPLWKRRHKTETPESLSSGG